MTESNFWVCKVGKIYSDDMTSVLETIVNCMYCGVIIIGPNNEFALWNERATEILGFGATDKPYSEWPTYYGTYKSDGVTLLKPHELPIIRASKGEMITDFEMFVKNEKQPGIWIWCMAAPIMKNNVCIGSIVAFKDITELKMAQKELTILKSKQQSLLNTLNVYCDSLYG